MVYGGEESVRHESGGLLNERQRLSRRKETGSTWEQNRKIEQDAEEGVTVVADLKRFDAEGTLTRNTSDGRHAIHEPPRQDFHSQ